MIESRVQKTLPEFLNHLGATQHSLRSGRSFQCRFPLSELPMVVEQPWAREQGAGEISEG